MITNINVGLTANDGLGDKLRNAFIIVNENFDAIDAVLTGTGTLTISQIAGLQTALTNIDNQLSYIPGLQSDINSINNTIYTINQTLNSQNASIADLYDEITNLQNQIYTKIEEAPVDGVTYGRRNGAWVVVSGGGGTLDLDGVLGNGNTAVDKEIHIVNSGATVTANITPSYISLINGSNTNTSQSNSIVLEDGNSGIRTSMFPNGLEFYTGATQYLKGNPTQNAGFLPTFLLPAKNLTANWTLATTADYTLQAVTTLNNTTNAGIQFQPVLNTGTGSKYVTVANNLVYLFSQSEGYSTITNDKIVWSRFGNIVSLSGWAAAGSNSADYILPTKSPATYTLATTADITVAGIVSGNTNSIVIVPSGTTRTFYGRGLTSSNSTISISQTGSLATAVWDIKSLNGVPVGGTLGQILAKNSATNYDTTWIDNYTEQIKTTVKADEAILKGQAVYVSGANGTNILIKKASNLTEATSSKTLGLLAQDLALNGQGFVITDGLLGGLDTSGATAGDAVWLGSTAGTLIFGLANKPSAPNHLVYIGVVTRVHATQGEIFIKPQNGFELREIHDVKITGVTNSQVLQYDGTDGLWKNGSLYSPVFNDVTNTLGATQTTTEISRSGDITLYGGTRYFRTLKATGSTVGTVWGHVGGGQGQSGFVSMFADGPNYGAVNTFAGAYASASVTEAQLTFCGIKDNTYAKWTDNRLLFRFQNGYYTNDKIFDIGTNYIQMYGYTSSRVDNGFTPVNYLTTDNLGVLKSRPITDLGLSFNATQRLAFLKI